jgi:hypothetical protein
MRNAAAVAILVLILGAPCGACPVCDTGTGRQVRAGILDENFGRTLLAVALPFPVLLAVVAVVHFGWPPFRHQNIPPNEGEPRRDDGHDNR